MVKQDIFDTMRIAPLVLPKVNTRTFDQVSAEVWERVYILLDGQILAHIFQQIDEDIK